MPRQPKPDPERLKTLEQRLAKEQFVVDFSRNTRVRARFIVQVPSWTFRAIRACARGYPGQRRPETCGAEFPDRDARWLAAVFFSRRRRTG
jgi:hypothetical protein